jgi:hypothetical protein
MHENVKLYAHWIFCVREKCANFNSGCHGSLSGRCNNPTFVLLKGIKDDEIAALDKDDSLLSEPDAQF